MPPLPGVRGCYFSAACRDSGRTMPAAFTLLAISTRLIATSYQNIPESSLPVLGNSPALRRMLFILLDNAIKYTPEGGTVSVGLHEQSGKAVLTVEDTGIGISEEAQSRIFQPNSGVLTEGGTRKVLIS
jgi:signal transduction histidine kinase